MYLEPVRNVLVRLGNVFEPSIEEIDSLRGF